jgi:hypothetical protein
MEAVFVVVVVVVVEGRCKGAMAYTADLQWITYVPTGPLDLSNRHANEIS